MLKLFQVFFYTGVFYTVISFLLGYLMDFAGIGGDADVDVDVDVDADVDLDVNGDISGAAVSPLKPIIIAAFATVFGGTGMIFAKKGYSAPASVAAALALGLGTAFLLYRFIIVPLHRAQNTSAVSQTVLVGSLARAALHMEGESFGKINYTVEGNTYSAPAKSIDGKAIAKGAPVVIIDIKKNVFYVKEVKGGSV